MKLAKTLALCTAALIVSASAAQAVDFREMVSGMSGKFVANWDDLAARRTELSAQIDLAVKQGQLTSTQAADFRKSLDAIAAEEAQAKAAGRRMSFVQSMQFGNQITALANALQQASTNPVTNLVDIDKLQAQLNAQIDTSVASGHLSTSIATTLRAELQKNEDIEAAYKRESGSLNPRQIELLSDELKKIQANIDQQVRVGQSAAPALNDKRVAIEAKINSALASGKLTAADATTLRQDLARVATEQQRFQDAGGGILNGTQVLRIAQMLDGVDDQLAVRVGTATNMPPVTTPGRRIGNTQELDRYLDMVARRLREAIDSNKISSQIAVHATRELDAIKQDEQNLVRGIAGISEEQVDELHMRARSLHSRIQGELAGTPGGPGGWSGGPGGPGGMDRPGWGDRPGGWTGGPGGGGMDGPNTSWGGRPGRGDRPGWGGRRPGRGDRPDMGGSGGPGGETETTLPVNVGGGATSIGELPVVNTKPLIDIRGYWGEQYVSELSQRGVIGGFPDGSFKPNDEITRAQFAAIVARALKLEPNPTAVNFPDVKAGYWGAGSIGAAVQAGLIGGFPDGNFGPEAKITRAQALVILSKALRGVNGNPSALSEYSDAGTVPGWARGNLATAATAGIIVNFPDSAQIRPSANATRGEVAGLMYQTLTSLGANLPQLRIGVLARR